MSFVAAHPIISALLAGSTAAGVASATQKPSMPDIPPLPQPPKAEDAEKKAAQIAASRRRAVTRNRTIYTSPLGVQQQATTARKVLLGA